MLRKLSSVGDVDEAVLLAGREAGRLRSALTSDRMRVPCLAASLRLMLAEERSSSGLRVELVDAELTADVNAAAAETITEVLRQAFALAAGQRGANRVVVRVRSTGDLVVITLRFHGQGMAPMRRACAATEPKDIRSVLGSMGGDVAVRSTPGDGIQWTITIPADDQSATTHPVPVGTAAMETDPSRRAFPGGPTDIGGDTLGYRQAERAVLIAFLSWRFAGLATGLATLVAGRGRYRSAVGAATQFVVAVGESAWLAHRITRRRRWNDPSAARADAAMSSAIVLVGKGLLDPADHSSWLNWSPWSLGANAVVGQAMGVESLGAAAKGASVILVANAAVSGRRQDAIASTAAMAAFFIAGRFFASQVRSRACRLEEAKVEQARRQADLAAEEEHLDQLRLLHDGALQVLEMIRAGWVQGLAEIRTFAAAEANRLQSQLRGNVHRLLLESVSDVVDRHCRPIMDVKLQATVEAEPPPRVVAALCHACDEALANVAKHASVCQAYVRLLALDGSVELVVADRGVGFDPSTGRNGFGIAESIVGRMADIGGSASVDSAPASGTVVTLRWKR